jgi:hypothetical protein
MKKQVIQVILITLSIVLFIQCSNDSDNKTIFTLPNDPFIKTISHIQTFEIDGKQDNVVEGESGTVIIFPKGCFKNGKGEVVEDNIKIELSEALTLEDRILSNLATTSNGKLLETGGMIYFNATSENEQLTVSKDNPIHVEIPTWEKKPGMMAYKGIRNANGNMNWIDPKPLDNFLATVDIDSLDFLPELFQIMVEAGMPYRKYKSATIKLTDSLYYSLSASNGSELTQGLTRTDVNEPYYDEGIKVVDGKYVDTYNLHDVDPRDQGDTVLPKNCGIDPAIIKVIKSTKYQNTLIATREFESRLKRIFKTCDNAILEIYIKNLDKNLYELDSMAAVVCEEKKYHNAYHAFDDFAGMRLTKVKQADRYAKLLNGYFEKQLSKVKSELERRKEKVLKSLRKENSEAKKVVDDYKKLLWKRERHRMETYGFDWIETGWVNVDNGDLPKDWSKEPLEIIVENGKQFDRVYTYVIYSSIKSLYRLNTTDNENFYAGNDADKEMLMPKQKDGVAIAIGYKGDAPSIAIKEFETGSNPKFSLMLTPSSPNKVKDTLRVYDRYSKENKIEFDLKMMEAIDLEQQRQKKLTDESEFIKDLWRIANPCCRRRGMDDFEEEL